MLKFYFGTIIFYMIALFGSVCVTAKKIKENGWLEGAETKNPSYNHFFVKLITTSCVPIFRFLMLIAFFVMACLTKEQVDEWKENK